MTEIYADVSQFQVLLDGTYPRRFVMFRLVNEYGNIDHHAKANLAAALTMRARGHLTNFGGYVNPGHAANSTILSHLTDLNWPKDAVLMMDIEAWPTNGVPLISGNHSAGFTALASGLRIRQDGRSDLVWAYANRGDLASLYPNRPAWLGLVIAGYNSNDPRGEYAQVIAWQYTNGVSNRTDWPSSSSPFGHCDHNALFAPIPTPTPGSHAPAGTGTPLEDDMPYSDWPQADKDDLTDDVATKVITRSLAGYKYDGTVGQLLVGLHGDLPSAADNATAVVNRSMAGVGFAGSLAQLLAGINAKVGEPAPAGAPLDVAALAQTLAADLGPDLGGELVAALKAAL